MPHLSLTNPLLDLWGVFFRHKLKCIAFVTVSLVLVLAGIVICPRKYGSEAKLLIKIGRENVALDPTEAVGQTMQVYHTREEEVNSVVEVMKSRRIAELVVEKIGADEILGKSPTSALAVSRESSGNFSLTAWLGGLAAPISRMDPVNDRERAIRHLKKRIGISAPRTTDVVSITYAASTPKLAQRVVQAWADVFMDEHVRLHRNEGSYEFFVEQEKLLQQQFDEATTALSTAKNEFGIVTVPGQQRILERQIEETERNILFKTTQLAASDAKIRALQERVADLDERVVVEEVQGVTNDAKDGMRQQLYELEIRERELLSKYLPGHPLVRAVQSQRRESENILSNQQEKTQSTKALNPTRQALQMQLLQEESQAESLRAETELLSSPTRDPPETLEDVERTRGSDRTPATKRRRIEYQVRRALPEPGTGSNERRAGEKELHQRERRPRGVIGRKARKSTQGRGVGIGNDRRATGRGGARVPCRVSRPVFQFRVANRTASQAPCPDCHSSDAEASRYVVLAFSDRPHLAKEYDMTVKQLEGARDGHRNAGGLRAKQTPLSEYYQTLLWRLESFGSSASESPLALGFTSCTAREGVSTIVTNLAVHAATFAAQRVLVVDANIFHPSAHKTFGVKLSPGFSEGLAEGIPPRDCIQDTTIGQLSVIAAGEDARVRAAVYDPLRIAEFVNSVRQDYRLVLFDLPVAGDLNASLALALASKLDGTVLIVEAGHTGFPLVQQTKQNLVEVGANIYGVVLNKLRARKRRSRKSL